MICSVNYICRFYRPFKEEKVVLFYEKIQVGFKGIW